MWSWRANAGAKCATMLTHRADDGGNKRVHQERGISCKPLRREGRLLPPVPEVNAPRATFSCAGAPGACGHPVFPAPSGLSEGHRNVSLGRIFVARMRTYVSPSSSPAKAGDPVRRGLSASAEVALEYWIVRSRLRQGFDGASNSRARRSFSGGGKPDDDSGS